MTSDVTRQIRRAAAGDRRAFDALVEPRWPRMFRIAHRIVGEREEAQDVAQQACLRLWQTLDRFRVGEDLDAWIYRMVTNLSIDALRRRRSRSQAVVPVADGQGESIEVRAPRPGACELDPERALAARELEDALRAATADLAPRQRAVFVLARIEGLSAAEIAEMLDVAPSTVRNHLFQARAHVARRLRELVPGLVGDDDAPGGQGGRA